MGLQVCGYGPKVGLYGAKLGLAFRWTMLGKP